MFIHPRLSGAKRGGFTLVELVIVVTIIIALAGVVTPRLTRIAEKADYARAATELKSIKRAAEILYADTGFFPDLQLVGVDPGFNDPAMVPAAVRSDWRGPYLETWPVENPFGGGYRFEYRNRGDFNFDGVTGNEVYISIDGGVDDTSMQLIDEIIDDGNTATGMARRINARKLAFFIGEGPDLSLIHI